MGAVKNYYHDEICASEQPDEPPVCEECGRGYAVQDGLCQECIEKVNAQ